MPACWHTAADQDTRDIPDGDVRDRPLVAGVPRHYGPVISQHGDRPMTRPTHPTRSARAAIGAGLALAVALAGTAQAAEPYRESDAYTVRFFDDYIFELCGIETWTTLTERWTFKEFTDGSTQLHVTRTFVPDDPRIPVEKGAGSSFTTPDGARTVVGKPIQLFDPDGGITLLAAGLTEFDEFGAVLTVHGHNPDLDAILANDLAAFYCP
jgi:hypothetical protein